MGKELICLDTSILIDYFRKKNKSNTILYKLLDNYEFAISVITKFELLTGSNEKQKTFWNEIFLKLLFCHLQKKI